MPFKNICINFKYGSNLIMNHMRVHENEDFEKRSNDIIDTELFSLKFTDSLYKKDIGKFLEFLSSYLI